MKVIKLGFRKELPLTAKLYTIGALHEVLLVLKRGIEYLRGS